MEESFFSFGSDRNVLDNQWLNLLAADKFFIRALSRVFKRKWFGIDNDGHLPLRINSTNLSCIDFFEVSFSLVELDFGFALQQWFTYSVFMNPFSICCADSKT